MTRAIERAAIDNDNALRLLRFDHERFHAAADACQARHFGKTLFRESARDAIRQFPGIRTTGAGIDNRQRRVVRVRFHNGDKNRRDNAA
jgi:hypothetical protein